MPYRSARPNSSLKVGLVCRRNKILCLFEWKPELFTSEASLLFALSRQSWRIRQILKSGRRYLLFLILLTLSRISFTKIKINVIIASAGVSEFVVRADCFTNCFL